MTVRLAVGALLLATPLAAVAQAPSAPVAAADAARRAAADAAVAALVPKGIYLRMIRDKFPEMMDAMMTRMGGMRAEDFGVPVGTGDDKTFEQVARDRDPAFRERLTIMTRVMSEEFGKVFDKVEPRIRTGLSRAFARKFTTRQLDDMNAFFATPSGTAFASEYLLTFMDPEVMQEMMGAMPEMMKAMPEVMGKVEKATAHLPPPPAPDTKAKEDD